MFDKPAEMFTSLSEQFPPDGVAPAMGYLAHESCTLNGEVIVCGGGQAQRLAIVESKGVRSDNLTPDYIAEHLDELMEMKDADVMEVHIALGEHG